MEAVICERVERHTITQVLKPNLCSRNSNINLLSIIKRLPTARSGKRRALCASFFLCLTWYWCWCGFLVSAGLRMEPDGCTKYCVPCARFFNWADGLEFGVLGEEVQ